jgi:hypothetical protein
MEKSVEQRKHKNDDRDAVDVLEKVRAHTRAQPIADGIRTVRLGMTGS